MADTPVSSSSSSASIGGRSAHRYPKREFKRSFVEIVQSLGVVHTQYLEYIRSLGNPRDAEMLGRSVHHMLTMEQALTAAETARDNIKDALEAADEYVKDHKDADTKIDNVRQQVGSLQEAYELALKNMYDSRNGVYTETMNSCIKDLEKLTDQLEVLIGAKVTEEEEDKEFVKNAPQKYKEDHDWTDRNWKKKEEEAKKKKKLLDDAAASEKKKTPTKRKRKTRTRKTKRAVDPEEDAGDTEDVSDEDDKDAIVEDEDEDDGNEDGSEDASGDGSEKSVKTKKKDKRQKTKDDEKRKDTEPKTKSKTESTTESKKEPTAEPTAESETESVTKSKTESKMAAETATTTTTEAVDYAISHSTNDKHAAVAKLYSPDDEVEDDEVDDGEIEINDADK